MGRHAAIAAVLALLAQPCAGTSTTDADGLFAAAQAAFEREDYVRAAEQFEAARAAGTGGPAILYNIGVSYYRAGEYAQAARSFRELAERHPRMRELAEYNLGLALHRQNRVDEARAAFRRASASDDPVVAELADEMLRRSAPQQALDGPQNEGMSWDRVVDVAVGYDDNVALVEEASLPAGRSGGSPSAELFGLISGRPGGPRALRVDVAGYMVRYTEAADFDQDGLKLALGYLWDVSAWRLDAGPHYQYSRLAGDGFEHSIGASLKARHPVGDTGTLSLGYRHDRVDELSAAFALVDGTRDRVSVGFQQRGARGQLRLGYVHERNDRSGASVSPTRHELFAGYAHELSDDWSLELHGLFRASRYEQLASPRSEDLSELSLTATRELADGWQLLGRYRVGENASSAEAFAYERNRLLLSVNRLF